MQITNRLGLPEAIVNAVRNDEYSSGPSDISVTRLISPPRMVTLEKAHNDELEEDASDRIFSLLGQGIHKVLERSNTTGIAEQRLYMTVPGPYGNWIVSGALDLIEAELQTDGSIVIEDYKTASVNEIIYGVKPERAMQLNCYKILAELNGYKVSGLRAIFILRDWSKVKAARASHAPRLGGGDPDYPPNQVVKYELPMWSQDDAYRFIGERVALHQQAQYAYEHGDLPFIEGITKQFLLPECDDEERWSRGSYFAAVKTGGSRASKTGTQEAMQQYIAEHTQVGGGYTVAFKNGKWGAMKAGGNRVSKSFPTEAEVNQWIAEQGETYELVEKPSEAIRCTYYCSVSTICEQFQRTQGEEFDVE